VSIDPRSNNKNPTKFNKFKQPKLDRNHNDLNESLDD